MLSNTEITNTPTITLNEKLKLLGSRYELFSCFNEKLKELNFSSDEEIVNYVKDFFHQDKYKKNKEDFGFLKDDKQCLTLMKEHLIDVLKMHDEAIDYYGWMGLDELFSYFDYSDPLDHILMCFEYYMRLLQDELGVSAIIE